VVHFFWLSGKRSQREPSSQKLQADESYRAGLTRKLQQQPQEENLPSAQQLNLFVKLYFTHFHPLFPVVHAATFRPSTENALLFLSICSVGSLFVGSERATAQGSRIFERLNKTILASWESFISPSSPDALSMVQAAVIGQTFAILSGVPRYLVLADVLHGTVLSWARECNRHFTRQSRLSNPRLADQDVEERWHRWIENEQRARVQVALHIHDAEISSLMHHEPVFRHKWKLYPRLASDALFNASTASKWSYLYRQSQSPSNLGDVIRVPPPVDSFKNAGGDSWFSAYSILESINARLVEARRSDSFDSDVSNKISHMLICWWRTYSQGHLKLSQQDPFCLIVLWHSTFISLYADTDILEKAIGRDGNDAAMDTFYPVCQWASSLDADRCLVHALLIQRHLEAMRVSSEPAIHVPRAIFIASLAWLCFTRFTSSREVNTEAFESPEIKLLGTEATECFQEAQGQAFGASVFGDVNHLHQLINLFTKNWPLGDLTLFCNCSYCGFRGRYGRFLTKLCNHHHVLG
jgi:Fungal specific transcription factor domain.